MRQCLENVLIEQNYIPESIEQCSASLEKEKKLLIEGEVYDEIGGQQGLYLMISKMVCKFHQ